MARDRQAAGDERRWDRRLVDVPIRIVADDLTGTGVILGRGTKISEGGICLFAAANLAIGAQIDVELVASDCGTPVRVGGIVRNRLVYLYGVEFVIEHPEGRQQIARLSHIIGTTTNFRSS
jgi:PilZ domain